jgi:hypothetical protein
MANGLRCKVPAGGFMPFLGIAPLRFGSGPTEPDQPYLIGSVSTKSHVPSLPRRITECFLAGCGEEGGMLDIVDW